MKTTSHPDARDSFAGSANRCVIREASIRNSYGVDIRTAAVLVNLARQFRSRIRLLVDGCAYGTEAIIEVLAADLRHGKRVTVIAEGPDAEAASAAVELFIAELDRRTPGLQSHPWSGEPDSLRRVA